VLAELINHSALTGVDIQITSAGQTSRRHVDFSSSNPTRAFFDLAALGDTVEAKLVDAADDLDADNVAYLARQGAPPRLEPRSHLPDALSHMIEVYKKTRPPTDGSAIIAVTTQRADLGAEPAVIVETPSASSPDSGEPTITTHPVTASVDWLAALHAVSIALAPPEGFSPLVTVAGRVAVAYRDEPARQIWVGFDSSTFPRTPDYVIFWSNVFTWLGGGVGTFVAHPVAIIAPSWTATVPTPPGVDPRAWPNVYKRPDGSLFATTAFAPQASAATKSSTPPSRPNVATNLLNLQPRLLLASIACIVLAALAWRSARSPRCPA
jgi:hypothetical protein